MVMTERSAASAPESQGTERPRLRRPANVLDSAAPGGQTHHMLFMVIETFKNGDPTPVGERVQRHGRLLPDGVIYEASWLEPSGARCFQIMHAPDRATLELWTARWSDLVDFDVVPVETSKQFWAQRQPQ